MPSISNGAARDVDGAFKKTKKREKKRNNIIIKEFFCSVKERKRKEMEIECVLYVGVHQS